MTQISEREAKITALVKQLSGNEDDLAMLRRAMRAAGFGMLGQVETSAFNSGPVDFERLANAREAVILDCETEGLDFEKHGVIQLSMQKVLYDDQGIIKLTEMFDKYRDPRRPLDPEITALTGITDAMVAGKSISSEEIRDFIGDADRIIAHNASFDRVMCENTFAGAGFDDIIWDCSIEQVDWDARGERSAKLETLMLHQGMVYDAHRADSDIRATAWMLNTVGPDGRTAFSEMLSNSDINHVHVFAHDAHFDQKEVLKSHGYRWAPPDDPELGEAKVWHHYFKATPEALEAEAELLRRVFGRDVNKLMFEWEPHARYSKRPTRSNFRTAPAREASEQENSPLAMASFNF